MGAHRTHTLKLIGDMRLPDSYLAQFRGLYQHVPSLPRASLVREYAAASVFVSNSMSEGMSIVIPAPPPRPRRAPGHTASFDMRNNPAPRAAISSISFQVISASDQVGFSSMIW